MASKNEIKSLLREVLVRLRRDNGSPLEVTRAPMACPDKPEDDGLTRREIISRLSLLLAGAAAFRLQGCGACNDFTGTPTGDAGSDASDSGQCPLECSSDCTNECSTDCKTDCSTDCSTDQASCTTEACATEACGTGDCATDCTSDNPTTCSTDCSTDNPTTCSTDTPCDTCSTDSSSFF